MIKTVFLDVDDTLFDFQSAERAAITRTLSFFGIEPDDNTVSLYREINHECWNALERREMERDQVLTERFSRLFSILGIDRDPVAVQSYYEEALSGEFSFVTGASELINTLHGVYRLYITSNGTARVQDGRIALSGIGHLFDGIYISERVGYHKPSREFFDRIFDEIGGERGETVIVGDSLSSDILGGINAGIHTCLFNPHGRKYSSDIKAEYEIRTLSELPELLKKI